MTPQLVQLVLIFFMTAPQLKRAVTAELSRNEMWFTHICEKFNRNCTVTVVINEQITRM